MLLNTEQIDNLNEVICNKLREVINERLNSIKNSKVYKDRLAEVKTTDPTILLLKTQVDELESCENYNELDHIITHIELKIEKLAEKLTNKEFGITDIQKLQDTYFDNVCKAILSLEEIDDYFEETDYDKYAQNEYKKGFFNLDNMLEFAENTRLIFSNIQKNNFTDSELYDK
jgi:hypothetical protein